MKCSVCLRIIKDNPDATMWQLFERGNLQLDRAVCMIDGTTYCDEHVPDAPFVGKPVIVPQPHTTAG